MKRNFSILFLTISLVLVLGHSLFPHNHGVKVWAERYMPPIEDFSLADILQFTLTRDLGINHLQDYLTSFSQRGTTSMMPHTNTMIISEAASCILFSKYHHSFFDSSFLLYQWDAIKCKRLRAPPELA